MSVFPLILALIACGSSKTEEESDSTENFFGTEAGDRDSSDGDDGSDGDPSSEDDGDSDPSDDSDDDSDDGSDDDSDDDLDDDFESEPCPDGVICVTSFPFEHSSTTSTATDDRFDCYSCAAGTD